jgi:hypothetical protein
MLQPDVGDDRAQMKKWSYQQRTIDAKIICSIGAVLILCRYGKTAILF